MNIKKIIAVTLLIAGVAQAADMTADEIVNKANLTAYYAGDDGSASVNMTLSDGRSREFVILRKDVEDGGNQLFYVYFKGPADVRKMSYLVHKEVDGDDARWLFLPALNLVKRIAPGDKRTSFVGSDFLYEDVSGRSLSEDRHEILKETDEYYLIKNTPKDAGRVEFSEYTVWIRKDNFLPVKAEYLDKNGQLYRRVAAEQIEDIQGHPTARRQVAEDVAAGTKTVIEFNDIKYDIGLTPQIFTERFLRRPPREVTK